MLLNRAVSQQLLVGLIALRETFVAHPGGRLHGRDGVVGLNEKEWPELTAEESSRVKGLEGLFFPAIERLSDIDEGREIWVQRSQSPGDP